MYRVLLIIERITCRKFHVNFVHEYFLKIFFTNFINVKLNSFWWLRLVINNDIISVTGIESTFLTMKFKVFFIFLLFLQLCSLASSE